MRKSKGVFWLFLAPCLLTFMLAVIIPMLSGIYYSFTDWDGIHSNCDFVGVGNYIKVFQDSYFRNSFVFTILFVIVSVCSVNILAFGLAILVTQKAGGSNLFRSIYFMPNLVGGVLVGFTWQFIVKDVFDSIGQAFHLNFLCNWLSTQATGF